MGPSLDWFFVKFFRTTCRQNTLPAPYPVTSRHWLWVFAFLLLVACGDTNQTSFTDALESAASGSQSLDHEQVTTTDVFVNRVPRFQVGPDIHVSSVAGPQEFGHWITHVDDGGDGGQRLEFEILSVSSPELFVAMPWVSYPSLTLRFVPKPGVAGVAEVALRVKDDGGTANGGIDTSPEQRFFIYIETPTDYINHAPSFRVGPDITVNGASGDFSMPDWASESNDGDDGTQSLRFKTVSNTRPELFDTPPWVSYPSHTLRFTPNNCVTGTAKIGLLLKDNGGTESGGSDMSLVQYFNITVQCPAPNNSPTFAVGPDIVVPATVGDAEFPGWATDVSDGDHDTQQLRFEIISNDNTSLFKEIPRVSYPSRTLRFTPHPTAEGVANLRIRLKDNGGTENGGSDTSITQTFSITITQPAEPEPNSPPIVSDIIVETIESTPIEFSLFGSDPENEALTYQVVSAPSHGQVSISGDRATYTPEDGFTGEDRFAYTANDGDSESAPAIVSISVIEQTNTPPVAESVEVSVPQGGYRYFTLQGVDADNDSLTYTLLSQPASGYLSGIAPKLEYAATADFTGKVTFE